MYVNKNECAAAGLDPAEVAKIARGLSRYAKQAQALGIQLFGGGTGGQLRFADGQAGDLILANLDGDFDGGDGSCRPDDEGLMRGECA
jgi:hypothetical protein